MKLFISLLDSKIVLTPKSHISLDSKFQYLLTYAPRLPMPLLALEVTIVLSGGCFFISILFSTILMLMTMSPPKTTCTHFGKL